MRRRTRSLPRFVAAAAVCLTAALPAEAEEPRGGTESATVTTSLTAPFFGAYEVEATLRASSTVGVLVNGSYLTLTNGDWRMKGGTVGAGINYYPWGSALRRWYVEAVGELMLASWRHEPSRAVAPVHLGYSGIALVGYQFVWDRGPVLDVGAGAVVLHLPGAQVDVADGAASSAAFTRVYPAVKINVGWRF
jgi:hypothetical protein